MSQITVEFSYQRINLDLISVKNEVEIDYVN